MPQKSHEQVQICVCCGKELDSLSELMRHMSLHHTEEEILQALHEAGHDGNDNNTGASHGNNQHYSYA